MKVFNFSNVKLLDSENFLQYNKYLWKINFEKIGMKNLIF
jgi:hypothetical protein